MGDAKDRHCKGGWGVVGLNIAYVLGVPHRLGALCVHMRIRHHLNESLREDAPILFKLPEDP